jgi:phage regulator Rha-like protein
MQALVISQTNARMTSREIAELVESRHDKVKQSIERLVERGVISSPPLGENLPGVQGGRPGTEYIFTGEQGKRDSIVVVAQLSPEFTAKLVDRWQELEKQLSSNKLAVPDFSNPAEAARAWADQYEARLHAEKTKALIGSKREATAMATASAEKRRANNLEIQLDQSKQYASIKRVMMVFPSHDFSWRMLKAATMELGLVSIDVFDANYESVKAYPAAAWMNAYAIDITGDRISVAL